MDLSGKIHKNTLETLLKQVLNNIYGIWLQKTRYKQLIKRVALI